MLSIKSAIGPFVLAQNLAQTTVSVKPLPAKSLQARQTYTSDSAKFRKTNLGFLLRSEQSNENKMSYRRTRTRVDRSGNVEIISRVERTAVRRSLHRLVRPFMHLRLSNLLPMVDEFTADLRGETLRPEADLHTFARR